MEEKTKEVKKGNSFLHILSNVLFVAVMVILIIFLGYGMGSVANNEVPSFFGTSYVRILSNSMEDSGFYVGDVVMLKKVQISEIKEGDIIAYYKCNLSPGKIDNTTQVKDFKTGDNLEGKTDNMIIFHQVDSVSVDTQGNVWFRTFGTSNGSLDSWWTRGDYVIGVYSPSIFSGIIKFMSSTTGIILLVIVPACIVLLLLLMNIIDLSDKIAKEKKQKQQELLDNIKKINKKNDVEGENVEQPTLEKKMLESEPVGIKNKEETTEDLSHPFEEQSDAQSESFVDEDLQKNDEKDIKIKEKTSKKPQKPKKSKIQEQQIEVVEQKSEEKLVADNIETEQPVVKKQELEEEQTQQKKNSNVKRKKTKQEKQEIMKQVDELVEKAKKK